MTSGGRQADGPLSGPRLHFGRHDPAAVFVRAEFLAAMPDGAVLVNVGRGQIVDTEALAAELQTGRLRAALDVTEPEPLPADHPIWACKNAIISPHMSWTVPGTNVLCYEVAARQIAAYVAGEMPPIWFKPMVPTALNAINKWVSGISDTSPSVY